MWYLDGLGQKVFRGGQENWRAAQEAAASCAGFRLDEEDELCAEELRSCYNCRYRRWTVESFTCMARPADGLMLNRSVA